MTLGGLVQEKDLTAKAESAKTAIEEIDVLGMGTREALGNESTNPLICFGLKWQIVKVATSVDDELKQVGTAPPAIKELGVSGGICKASKQSQFDPSQS